MRRGERGNEGVDSNGPKPRCNQGRKRSGNQTKMNERRRARKKPIIKLLKKPPPNSSIEPLLKSLKGNFCVIRSCCSKILSAMLKS
jgi:hypothetical protein